MESTEQTRIQRCYAGLIEQMRDVVELSRTDDPDDVSDELLSRLDIDRDTLGQYPQDIATELADGVVYAIERLALVNDDGTAGELRSVELLLGGGGPTITLTADVREDDVRDFTLWHSWGSAVGEEASMRSQSHEDRETVEAFLGVLGVLYL